MRHGTAQPLLAKLLFAGILLLAGCQSALMLMPTPEVLKDERFNVFQMNPQPMTSNRISTLFATTRVPDANRPDFFRGEPDTRLHLGYADLQIGDEGLELDDLLEQSTTGERREKLAWHLLNATIVSSADRPSDPEDGGPILEEEVAAGIAKLNDYINTREIKELTIYVHGANNTFYWSVSQATQFQYFTGDNAIVMAFAWPSPGSMWRYGADKRRADAAATDLAYLIEILARHSVATRINLLAYSAGGRVVGRALAELARRHSEWSDLRIGQVYLTQSDQPLLEFVQALPSFYPLVEGLTVTAAADDPVLALARMTDRRMRLGSAGGGGGYELDISDELRQQVIRILNEDHVLLIDLRHVPAQEYRFTHGAWYESPWVSTDVMATLLGGLTWEERGLERIRINDVHAYVFPEDYLERLKANLLRLQQERSQPQPGQAAR